MTYSVFTPFLRRFTDEVEIERGETIALYERVRKKHFSSVWAASDIVERISNQIADIVGQLVELPGYVPLGQALDRCQQEIIAQETTVVSFPELDWSRAHLSMSEAVDLRRFLRAKEHFLANDERVYGQLQTALGNIMGGIVQNLPPIPNAADSRFTVPLFETMRNPSDIVAGITTVLVADELVESGLFADLQNRLYENVCEASGIAPHTDTKRRLITADQSDLPAQELLTTYLSGTPFLELFQTPVPFSIPEETRFSGHWIIAPPGRGKTTLLHAMFVEDFDRQASIIVMDSKGDLINPIKELAAVKDRLVLIEPDPDYPLALNPLDIPKTSIAHTVSLLEYIFTALLEAKPTPKQLAFFRNVLPAIVQGIPNCTLHTFYDLIANGIAPYRQHLDRLPAVLRDFFDRQFDTQYADTRKEMLWRLDLMMANPIVKQMFTAPKTKFNVGDQMDAGKIIIIDNSKALLADEGSEFFGRFFIALVLAAAQQRASRKNTDKLPCYFYIDECQSVIKRDEKIPIILDECRSQKIALILAHQRTDQIISPNVLSALSNCAIRMANSDDEAKYLADKLRADTDFLRSLPRGTFATFVRDLTPRALALNVPYTDLSTLPRMSPAEQQAIRDDMRAQFSVTPAVAVQTPTTRPSLPAQASTRPPPPVAPPADHPDPGEPAKDW